MGGCAKVITRWNVVAGMVALMLVLVVMVTQELTLMYPQF